MKYTPKQPEFNDNVTPTSPLKDLLVMAGGLLAIAIGVYLVLGFAVDLIVPRLSPKIEAKMAGPMLAARTGRAATPERQKRLQDLLDRLQKDCTRLPYDFQVHVYREKTVNALALPGGHILVFTGLLDKVASENELAFVLAHELGHYAHRDHLRGIGRALVFMAMSAFLFGPDSRIGNLMAQGLHLTEMSFSRRQELQADVFALNALYCLYGHAGGATDFFHRMASARDPGVFGHYFATHPRNQQRIDRLNALINEKKMGRKEKTALPPGLGPSPKKDKAADLP